MNQQRKTLALCLAASLTMAMPASVSASGNEAHAESEICLKLLRPIEIYNLYKLDLGRHVFNDGGVGGNIWIGTDGSTTVDGSLMTLEKGFPATFEVWGEKECAYNIEVHGGTLYNQMDPQFKLETELVVDETMRVFPEDYHEFFAVGAHLEVPPGQMTGVYNGHFEVWVQYK